MNKFYKFSIVLRAFLSFKGQIVLHANALGKHREYYTRAKKQTHEFYPERSPAYILLCICHLTLYLMNGITKQATFDQIIWPISCAKVQKNKK